MAVSLILSSSVSYPSDTTATVSVTLKAKSTSGSYNKTSSSYGYIKINGTKYGNFSHTFSANTTTTLGTKSHSVTRTTATQSIPTYGWWHTDVSSGNISKSGSQSVAARPLYTVTFNANGGTGSTSVGVYSGYTTTFPYSSRTGYTFGSWNGYAQGAATPAITSSRTYTASWNLVTYTISYNGNGGTLPSNLSSYNVTSAAFTLVNPTSINYTGYDFTGWTGTNGTTPSLVVTIPQGSTGNRSYTANWRLNIYTIKLDTLGGNINGMSPTYEPVNPNSNPAAEIFYEFDGENYILSSDTSVQSGKTYYKKYYILTKNHGETIDLPPASYPGDSKLFGGWERVVASNPDDNLSYLDSCDWNGVNYNDILILTTVWSDAVRPLIYHFYNSATNSESIYRTNKIFNRPMNLTIPTIPNYTFKNWHEESIDGTIVTRLGNKEYDLWIETDEPDFDDLQISWYIYNEANDEFIETKELIPGIDKYYKLDYNGASDNPIEVYGEWNKVYTVNFFANSPTYDDGIEAQGYVVSMEFENDVSRELPSAATNYVYQSIDGEKKCEASGWSINPGDNTVAFSDNYSLTLQGRPEGYVLNLYAAWRPKDFTITLDKGSKSADDTSQDRLTGDSNKEITLPYFTTVSLPLSIVQLSDSPTGWRFPNHSLSRWTYTEINTETEKPEIRTIFPGGSVVITSNKTYVANWVAAYHIPIITSLITRRYLDDQYETINKGGKYLYFEASGIHGSYDTGTYVETNDTTIVTGKEYYRHINDSYELVVNPAITDNPQNNHWYEKEKAAVDLYKYLVDIKFYDSETTTIPVATFKKEVTSTTAVFHENWKTFDRQLNMLYCVLTIVDSTNYGENVMIPIADRTFTFTFSIDLERAIALHIADDISAISMFKELEDDDKGLVVHNDELVKGDLTANNFFFQKLWAWRVDPLTRNLYIEWIGE